MSGGMAGTPQATSNWIGPIRRRSECDPGRNRGAWRSDCPGSGGDRPGDFRPGRGDRSNLDHFVVGRARSAGRRARPGQKPAGGDAGRRAGHGHQAHPVHPRPDAGRHRRQRGAGRNRGPPRLPLRSRPGVLPVADGRRDQPRQPAHPVRPAAGDAGAAGRHRRRRARAAAAVPRAGDAEPDRAGRHLSAAGGAARPVPAGGQRQLPRPATPNGRCCWRPPARRRRVPSRR